MRFEIVTIFPGFFAGIFVNGIIRRALAEGLVTVGVHDLRNYTHDRHRTVDDRPFGGGEGMVLKPEPLAEALASLGIEPKSASQPDQGTLGIGPKSASQPSQATTSQDSEKLDSDALYQGTTSVVPQKPLNEAGALAPEGKPPIVPTPRPTVILLSAQGRPFTQALARELAALDRVVLICGRYEGVDERINQLYCDMELSIGDYVLSGGELAAAVVLDATMRLIPGVLGNEASGEFESFGVPDAEARRQCRRRSPLPARRRRPSGLPSLHPPRRIPGPARPRSPPQRRPPADSPLAPRAAVAQDPGQPPRPAGARLS